MDELKLFAKLDDDGGGNAGTPVLSRRRTRSGRLLDGSNQVRRMDSKLLRCSPRRAGSGPCPMGSNSRNGGGVAMVEKGKQFAVMLVVQ